MKKSKQGFTLVELLAVIVILAIILVIAVPKVMSVIEDSKKATLESTAKMIASQAEKAKVQNTVLGNDDAITCDSVAKINKLDYDSCNIEFENNTAKVTITGKGKFEGMAICKGTKTNSKVVDTCEQKKLNITIQNVAGGTMTTDKTEATAGETVTLTPTADSGYVYKGATVSYIDESDSAQTISLDADTFSFEMPVGDVLVTPKWEENAVTYKVLHWQQTVTGGTTQNSSNFSLYDTENLEGIPGVSVSPDVKSYDGFNSASKQTITIAKDGSTVVNYYYTRMSYNVTLDKIVGVASVTGAGTYRYGTSVTIDATLSSGFTWDKWSGTFDSTTKKYTFTMPANNVSLTANVAEVAQAIYSATDNSLTFIRGKLLTAGQTFVDQNGKTKTVTDVYTGFEIRTDAYGYNSTPWKPNYNNIKSVAFRDEIKPNQTQYWFGQLKECSSFDVTKLNTSNVSTMSNMFYSAGYNAQSLTITGMENWNTENVTTMEKMFANIGCNASSMNIGNISKWETKNVVTMYGMFDGAFRSEASTGSVNIDLSGWNVSKVTTMQLMFRGFAPYASKVSLGDLGEWTVSSLTNASQMFESVGSYNDEPAYIGDLTKWKTASLKNVSYMFLSSNTNSLDLSNWNVSNVTVWSGFSSNSNIISPSFGSTAATSLSITPVQELT